MIDRIFLRNLIKKPNLISDLKFEEISVIIDEARTIFSNETLLLEFEIKQEEEIYVLGDIHGNLETLISFIKVIEEKKPKLVISLGDIVDRGPSQMECLVIILSLKILNPNSFYLLKGNHETLEMNQSYGFFYEFVNRYKDYKHFKKILQFYNVLPICSIINNLILCLHGGIPEDFEILNKIRDIKTSDHQKIITNSIEYSLFQIMWNDPKENINDFTDSFRGLGIKFFGIDVFNKFMKINNLKYLIRAHEYFPEGYKWFFNKRLLSIFSSANYRHIQSPASYAIIKNNEIIGKILEPL